MSTATIDTAFTSETRLDLDWAARTDIWVTVDSTQARARGTVSMHDTGYRQCSLTVWLGTCKYAVSDNIAGTATVMYGYTPTGKRSTRTLPTTVRAQLTAVREAALAAADEYATSGRIDIERRERRQTDLACDVQDKARRAADLSESIARLTAELATVTAQMGDVNANLDAPLTDAQLTVLTVLSGRRWSYDTTLDLVAAARVALTDTQVDTLRSLLHEWNGTPAELVHAARTL